MIVNGSEAGLSKQMTVSEWLVSNGHDLSRCAVLLNGNVVRRTDFDSTVLSDSDSMEIVTFVGGG